MLSGWYRSGEGGAFEHNLLRSQLQGVDIVMQ